MDNTDLDEMDETVFEEMSRSEREADDEYETAMLKNYIKTQLDESEIAVGPLFACQLCIKAFLEDLTNMSQFSYAISVYMWLGQTEYSVDELFIVSYDKALFILEVLEKYGSGVMRGVNSNVILNYGEAFESLKYQKRRVNILKRHFAR